LKLRRMPVAIVPPSVMSWKDFNMCDMQANTNFASSACSGKRFGNALLGAYADLRR
jgi:hypothetical protein